MREPWLFTIVYENPNTNMRAELWNDLESISLGCKEDWLIAGDFNNIGDPSKKKGVAFFNWHKANNFNDKINRCKLMELETQGGRYTWKCPKVQNFDKLFEKLDRALCNVS